MTEGIAIAAIGAAGAILSAYFAHRAEKNSRPVSNGFAAGVNRALSEIQADLREMRTAPRQDWLDHYNNHHND